jgi:glycolate oxidase iron-sulfur subunit
MQTNFSLAQLADPDIAEANKILRACVHCGFCTATCPTYVLLGDELDSPRGRIYLIKEMFENDRPASATVVKHIDRCLSCLACMTTCPSGVHYMHLVDHARAHIEATFKRPIVDRALRALLASLMPRPGLFRIAMLAASLLRPFAPVVRALGGKRVAAMLALAPHALPTPSPMDRPQVFAAEGERRMRVALLAGCVQPALAPAIGEATVRLLTRHGVEVVNVGGVGCCGGLTHHMGKERSSHAMAKANILAWEREREARGLDAIVVNASGCGTTLKDYGFMFRNDPEWAARAERVAGLARDVTEVMAALGLRQASHADPLTVAYHSACSMQHGQKLGREPRALLTAAGFSIREIGEAHLCCGSAGTYNMLQPELATRLRDRKAGHVKATGADLVATGNLGCMTQLAPALGIPVVHTVELLDWATGGPRPASVQPSPL